MIEKKTRLAAYGIIKQGEKILLCRLSDQVPNSKGYWTLPGGGVEFGEDPKDTVAREVIEETGLEIEVCNLISINSIKNNASQEPFHSVRIIYEVKVIGGTLKNEINGTTDLCSWLTIEEINKLKLVSLAKFGIELTYGKTEK